MINFDKLVIGKSYNLWLCKNSNLASSHVNYSSYSFVYEGKEDNEYLFSYDGIIYEIEENDLLGCWNLESSEN